MRAIILCAGKGERCRPVTLYCPKPLIPVGGIPLVERQIIYLRQWGISDITIVTGYMEKKFAYLEKKYNLHIRFSPYFSSCNNNTSVQIVKDILDDSLILDGDLYFTRNWLPHLKAGISQFLVQPVAHSLEWKVKVRTTDEGNTVLTGVDKWTNDGFGMSGVSYWVGEGAKFLALELAKAKVDEYWEDSAIRAANKTDILCNFVEPYVLEIDTLNQAKELDLLSDEEIAALCSPVGKHKKLKGLTNNTYLVHAEEDMALRIPGKNTEQFIDRKAEPEIISLIKEQNITPSTKFFCDGYKLCKFLPNHRVSCSGDMNSAFFTQLSILLGQLHAIPYSDSCHKIKPITIFNEIIEYENRLRTGNKLYFDDNQRESLKVWAKNFDSGPCVLCHRDLLLENILIQDSNIESMRLIDFEYSGFTHPLWDTASFILEAELNDELRLDFFQKSSPGYGIADLERMEILVDYIWGIWGYVNNYNDYAHMRLIRASKNYAMNDNK